jgi:agmatinase
MLVKTAPISIGRPSFLATPRTALPDLVDADVVVLGIPYTTPHDLASSRAPCSLAPAAVREQSLRYAGWLEHYDFDFGGDLLAGRRVRLVDAGDAWAAPGRYAENDRAATAAVGAILDRGALPIVLGGDHAAAVPALRACGARGPLGVVHLGATLDWRDDVAGVGATAASAMRRASDLPGVAAMIHIGLRGAGHASHEDVEVARARGSVLVRAEEVQRLGVAAVLRRLPSAPRCYVSLDVGVLDPGIAPGVDTPAFGGLSYVEVSTLLRGIAARRPVVGFDLVGIVPAHDRNDQTSLLGARLILNLIGALAHAGRLGVTEDRTPAQAAARRVPRPASAPLEPALG